MGVHERSLGHLRLRRWTTRCGPDGALAKFARVFSRSVLMMNNGATRFG
jgi:hypothetical protein